MAAHMLPSLMSSVAPQTSRSSDRETPAYICLPHEARTCIRTKLAIPVEFLSPVCKEEDSPSFRIPWIIY